MVKDLINEVIDAKKEAEKQAAVKTLGGELVDYLLAKNVAAIEELVQKNTFVEVYNVSEHRDSCPFSRPIEIAVHMCLPDALEMLLNAGADPDVTHPQVYLYICV